ncbi:MAG: glycoside hydrolase family 3 protein [Polyangiaceae bacterium]|nr:glycoside hydrolase family 3 protein [Polyangiaceae bacterium]
MTTRTLVAASVWIGMVSVVVGCGSDTNDTGQTSTSGSGGQDQSGGAAQGGSASGGNSTAGGNGDSGGTSGSASTSSGGGTASHTGGTVSYTGGTASYTGGTTSYTGGSGPGGGSGTAPGGGSGVGGTSPGGTGPAGGTSNGGTGNGGGSAMTGGGPGGGGAAPTGGTGGVADQPPELPVAVQPWTPSEACKAKAAQILGALSVKQKVAQMIQGETISTTTDDVKNYQLGAVFDGGGGDPPDSNRVDAWINLANGYHQAAVSFGIPLLYGIDAVHGHNNVRDATMFPHNIGLGCSRDPDLVRRVFRATAEEVRGTGINWSFAPTIAAARDERWGRTFETFSEDPSIVAWLGEAAVNGFQRGTDLKDPLSILGCAKHFAGDGNTANGEDQGDVIMDDATFHRLAVNQYQYLINSGVATVMISYSQYGTSSSNLQRVTGNKALVTDMLKTQMGFAGIVVSDYNAIMQLPGGESGTYPPPSAAQVAAGVNAGLDMLMLAGTTGTEKKPIWQSALELLEAAVPSAVPESRVDDAVTRILQVKCEMGMFESGYSVQTDKATVGSAEHRAVAREAVAKSLVVLKNDENVLPVAAGTKVLVAGTAADSMPKQCGGWTVDWQGLGTGTSHSPDADTTAGTTVLAGIRAAVGDGNVTFSADGTGDATGAAAGIVVVGESPYAEGRGDATDLSLKARSAADDTALTNMLGKGIPVVLVIISGRPLIIDSYLGNANLKAVVAAWLPGSEGDGIADVLFGMVKPTGKLGHSWPKSAAQIPVNWDDADYTSDPPAFPIGHGLTW